MTFVAPAKGLEVERSLTVPEPIWVMLPLPPIGLDTLMVSVRSNTRLALSVTLPVLKVPEAPPLPIWSVPALIVVPPVYALVAASVKVPLPILVRPSALELSIAPARTTVWPLVSSETLAALLPVKRVAQSCPALTAVYCSVPPLKAMLPEPRALALFAVSVPA